MPRQRTVSLQLDLVLPRSLATTSCLMVKSNLVGIGLRSLCKAHSMFCLTRRKAISVVEKIYDRGLLDGAPVTETVPPLSPCNHSNNLMQLSFDTFSSKNSGLSIVVWQIFVIALLIFSCCCAFNSASKQTKALQNIKSFKIHLVSSHWIQPFQSRQSRLRSRL